MIHNIALKALLLVIRPIINKKAQSIICITRSCAAYMARLGFKRVTYIPVPFATPDKSPIPAGTGIHSNNLRLLCVARFEAYKGHKTLLRAIADMPQIHLTLAGEGVLKKQLEEYARESGTSDRITFAGHVSQEKLAELYRSHHIFMLPSISEPVGAVVFEAMAFGMPIIVSSTVGAKDAVHEGKNGFIFESGNASDLQKKLELLRDSGLRKKFGEESIKIIREEYDPEKIKELYKKTLMPGSEN